MPAILFYNFNFLTLKYQIYYLLQLWSCGEMKWNFYHSFSFSVTVKSKLLNLGIKQEFSADLKREEKNRRTVYIFAPKNCQEKH